MFINLVAPLNQLGYGVVGMNILKALHNLGHTISWWPIGQAQWECDLPFAKKCLDNAKIFNSKAPSIRLWHQNDMAMFPGGGERIGWPIFELDRFTMQEHTHLSSVDRLFVCSEWAKEICKQEKIDVNRIDVVPLGVDGDVFYVDEEARNNRAYWTRDKTVFLNCGKWEVRKGHLELLEAFNRAFEPGDNVELWMLNQNDFIGLENEQWKLRYLSSKMGDSIKILPRVGSQHELRQLFNTVDCGVFPAHAEGFNLEPLELMACGVPSIVTNYSGHTEYCNDYNSLLLEVDGMTKAQDGKWFTGQGDWAIFSVDKLAELMKAAHDERELLTRRREAALETAKQFSWENSATKIVEVLG